MTPPVVLSIAGSDSGGGAGIQADLRTCAALGVFGTTAITAVTAQNTLEVRAVHALPPEMVEAQIRAVTDDLHVAAVKTGMLADEKIVTIVAELAEEGCLPNLVVDPVLVASTGAALATAPSVDAYLARLLPLAQVITPNLHEAGRLLGRTVATLDDQRDAARDLGSLTGTVVVVKGGHAALGSGADAVDIVWDGSRGYELRRPRVDTINNHGSGCSFSSAIAAGLAAGRSTVDAIAAANEFVHRAIVGGADWQLGGGHGPLNHFSTG
ncbi:MAG: bifunctional hydroxymethylpyrimidine kinase/phosphomethylpyrimidine kinase [Acidimicrobiaceae bacterium]|nr:bifunctional hydroxymethylpyrimidine kinase/phosphomethylpyrimidine kinase [Acidimicrobiaceae bacterium]